jgi:hypothetical protein
MNASGSFLYLNIMCLQAGRPQLSILEQDSRPAATGRKR